MVSNADVVRTLERIADRSRPARHGTTAGNARGHQESVHVEGGFQVDCRAVPPGSFGAAPRYFTGSPRHDVRLRSRALRMEMTLNEYGVFRNDDGVRVARESEDDVYQALGLSWIPPQRREDPAEIDSVAQIRVATEV